MKVYLFADSHMGHANIIRYCNRPFKSVEEMDETLLANINSRVRATDQIFCLGDFAFGGYHRIAYYRKKIRCRNFVLVKGNHDRGTLGGKTNKLFTKVVKSFCGWIHSVRFVLTHRPARDNWEEVLLKKERKEYPNLIYLHGHSHRHYPGPSNICMDNTNYMPLSLQEVLDRFSDDKQTDNL